MFGRRVPIQKTNKQGGRICALLTLSENLVSPNISGSFPYCNTGSFVFFGIQTLLLLLRGEEDWLHRPQPSVVTQDCRNLLPIYTLLFSEYEYIYITVTCVCVSILARVWRSHMGRNMSL